MTQPKKQTRKRHLGGAVPIEATHPNHVWTYDFVHDRTENGHPLQVLTVEDEYTREGLAVEVGRSLLASRVKEVVESLILDRGAPEYVRSDNGPELIAVELTEWLMDQSVKTHHIDPGSPWQNAYGESFNSDIASRVSQLRALPQCAGSPDQDRSMAKSLQYEASAQWARFLDTDGVS